MQPPTLDPARFPRMAGVERPFFDYWWSELIDPHDPQKYRWLEMEEAAVDQTRAYVDKLGDALPLDGAKVLDVGCQNGATLVSLATRGARPTGIEVNAKCARAAEIRLRCHGIESALVVASACEMPFEDASFDGVVASNVIEHVPDARAMVRECARVLKPGGVLYIDGPNRLSPKQFLSDPHYRMAFVSAMPARWARFYVTRVRKFPAYDAETFPIRSQVRRWLRSDGVELPPEGVLQTVARDLAPMFEFVARKRAR